MTSVIPFKKMHGAGNDFIIIDGRVKSYYLSAEIIKAMADRHRGIGCDQLVYIKPISMNENFIQFWNADGSEAEACGNATRCVGKMLLDENKNDSITLQGPVGPLLIEKHDDQCWVKMGSAILEPITPAPIDKLKNGQKVNIGNPHWVFHVLDADKVPINEWGPMVENFVPSGVNVEFVHRISANVYRQRTWERGAGETLACGTGACAVAATLNQEVVKLECNGGTLTVKNEEEQLWLTGPVATSFHGVFNL